MSSEHPFDDKLNKAFDGFEPNVHANWAEFEQSLSPETLPSPSSGSSSLNRWAMAAAVAAGGALMWVAKPVVDVLVPTELSTATNQDEPSDGIEDLSFDEAWEEFTNLTDGFVEDAMDADSEQALANKVLLSNADEYEEDVDNRSTKPMPLGSAPSNDAEARATAPEATENASTAADGGLSYDKLMAELPFDASVREACAGIEVAFELTGLDREMSFLWNFGDGNFSSDPAPRHVFNRPGTYDITLSVRPPGDGSISTRTIQNMITVLPKPEAQFAWAFPAAVSGNKVRVQLKDETPTATSSQWVVDGESSRNGLVQLDVPGVYPVNMVVSNHHGCLDDAHQDIHVGDRHGLLAQARFSPNYDGHYDTFLPHSLKDMLGPWEMVVTDAEGVEVFRTSNAMQPWDGVLPNGEMAKDRSTYQWTVRCNDENGNPRLFTDRVRIER